MDALLENVNLFIVILGAGLGSIRASLDIHQNKNCFYKAVDIALGLFVGCMAAYHLGNENGSWLNGLIALIGGVSGAMVVDVFLQMLPNLTKQLLRKKLGG